jgi:hypothetical protein
MPCRLLIALTAATAVSVTPARATGRHDTEARLNH